MSPMTDLSWLEIDFTDLEVEVNGMMLSKAQFSLAVGAFPKVNFTINIASLLINITQEERDHMRTILKQLKEKKGM